MRWAAGLQLAGSLFPGLADPSRQAPTLIVLAGFFFVGAGISFLWQGVLSAKALSGWARDFNRRAWMFFALPGLACLVMALISVVGFQAAIVWLLTGPSEGGLRPIQAVLVGVYLSVSMLLILVGPRQLWRASSDLVRQWRRRSG
jgi:hypothetical protein